MTKLVVPLRNFANEPKNVLGTDCKTSQYRIPDVLYFILEFSHMPRVKHGIEEPIPGALRIEGGRKWRNRTQFPHYELHDPLSFSTWRISSWSRYRTAGLHFPCRIRNPDYSTLHNEAKNRSFTARRGRSTKQSWILPTHKKMKIHSPSTNSVSYAVVFMPCPTFMIQKT
jgi:hypothetical protein